MEASPLLLFITTNSTLKTTSPERAIKQYTKQICDMFIQNKKEDEQC